MSWLLAVLLSCQIGTPAPDCIIVEFASENCGPCKQLQPALEQLKREGWVVRTVDVEREPLLVRKFSVESLPTLVLVSKGKEVDRIVGAAPYEKILPRLAKLLLSSNASALDTAAAAAAPKNIPVQAAPLVRSAPSSAAENWQATSRAQQITPPKINSQPELTVRGQSPASGAFPMLAAASPSPANALSSQSIADKFNSLSTSAPTVSAPTTSLPANPAGVSSAGFSAPAQSLPEVSTASAVTPAAAAFANAMPSLRETSPRATSPRATSPSSGLLTSSPVSSPAQPAVRRSAPVDLQKAIARAEAATVRIRVDEQNSTAYGTGTVIDVHGDEALVLTCGHLFREMKPHSQLTVDLFAGRAQPINVPAQLIDFQATPGEEDVGLLSFKLPFAIEAVPLLPQAETLTIGQPAFSFGCDHGQNPTRHDTNVKNINRYLGAPNLEISGAPAVGRSGGGLFDQQGRLIGVCNAADAAGDEGIYAAAGIVYTQLDRLKLSHLFNEGPPTQPNQAQPPQALLASGPASMQRQPEFNSLAAEPVAMAGNQPPATATRPAGPQTLICIVRDAGGREQVMTVDSPTADLVQAISLQAGR